MFLPAFSKPPFSCANEGWGEFEISIDCYTTEKSKVGPAIIHDLNFLESRYEVVHTVTFKNPSQALQERLRETGPLPNDDKKKAGGGRKSSKFDYEKIAEALEKLEEEDLLRVIQLINENKGPETYIRSDVDGEFHVFLMCRVFVFIVMLIVDDVTKAGEFSIDLYTMPDALTAKLWEHLVSCEW